MHVAIAVISLVLLCVPIVGLIWPQPPYPVNLFPYIFGAYLIAGVILITIRSKTTTEIESVRLILEEKAMSSAPALPAGAPATGKVAMA